MKYDKLQLAAQIKFYVSTTYITQLEDDITYCLITNKFQPVSCTIESQLNSVRANDILDKLLLILDTASSLEVSKDVYYLARYNNGVNIKILLTTGELRISKNNLKFRLRLNNLKRLLEVLEIIA